MPRPRKIRNAVSADARGTAGSFFTGLRDYGKNHGGRNSVKMERQELITAKT